MSQEVESFSRRSRRAGSPICVKGTSGCCRPWPEAFAAVDCGLESLLCHDSPSFANASFGRSASWAIQGPPVGIVRSFSSLVGNQRAPATWPLLVLGCQSQTMPRAAQDAPLHIRADPEVIFAAVAVCGPHSRLGP